MNFDGVDARMSSEYVSADYAYPFGAVYPLNRDYSVKNRFGRNINCESAVKPTYGIPSNGRLASKTRMILRKDNLHSCTEELGAESISSIGKGTIGSPKISVSELGGDNNSVKNITGAVNAVEFGIHDTKQGHASYHLDIRNERNGCSVQKRFDALEEDDLSARFDTSSKLDKFPPPISSIARTASIVSLCSHKIHGRFVLQKVVTPPSKVLQAKRENGRLTLKLVLHDNDDCVQPSCQDKEGEYWPESAKNVTPDEERDCFAPETGEAEEFTETQAKRVETGDGFDAQVCFRISAVLNTNDEMGSPFQTDQSREDRGRGAGETTEVSCMYVLDPGPIGRKRLVTQNSQDTCLALTGLITKGGELSTAGRYLRTTNTKILQLPIGVAGGITRPGKNRVEELGLSNESITRGTVSWRETIKTQLSWTLCKSLLQQVNVLPQLERTIHGPKLCGVYWHMNAFPLVERGATFLQKVKATGFIPEGGKGSAEKAVCLLQIQDREVEDEQGRETLSFPDSIGSLYTSTVVASGEKGAFLSRAEEMELSCNYGEGSAKETLSPLQTQDTEVEDDSSRATLGILGSSIKSFYTSPVVVGGLSMCFTMTACG